MFNKTYTKIKGRLRFIGRHPILNELVDYLYEAIDGSELNKEGDYIIFCGAHKRYYFDWFRRGYKIAIQTEQFYDDNGRKLWGIAHIKKYLLKSNIRKANLVIDLNYNNKIFYQNNLKLNSKDLSKVVFGPYIFPSKKNLFIFKSGGFINLFYGGVNERRQEIIENLNLNYEIVSGVLGIELKKIVSESLAVLNIHFQDGVYTEWPRLFSALLCGKVVISERLAKPLEPNIHYITIEKHSDVNIEDYELIYNNLATFVINHFSLVRLINEKFLDSSSSIKNLKNSRN